MSASRRTLWALAATVALQMCMIQPVQALVSSSKATSGGNLAQYLNSGGPQSLGTGGNGFIKIYCDGIGANNNGVDCPCGNTLPPGSDVGCANRTGHGASLLPSGVPSISQDTLVLTASGMPLNVPAFFLEGGTTGGPVVFGNGIRCISGPFVRLSKVAHSSGNDSFPAPNTPPISQQLNLSPGDQTFFQAVYRDLGGPCGSSINATNAVMVVWGT